MRIAYGIHGYGRGHSSRALAVLPEMTARHDVLVLAGDDAYRALADDYDVAPIPVLRYELDETGRRRPLTTLRKGLGKLADIRRGGQGLRDVCARLEAFRPDVVVSDSEAWTHAAARRLSLPRISFDHFGVLVWCAWPMCPLDRLACRFEAFAYKTLMSGPADRMVVVSFYAPPARRPGVKVVGPVLRSYVQEVQPTRGEYLLVYFTNGQSHYTPEIEAALHALDEPVKVYGVGREGSEGKLTYCPPSNTVFVDDLAGCRCVFSTAGNQLISEAMHYRKPMLLLPEDALEQRLNAAAIEKMGVGLGTRQGRITPEVLRGFWQREPELAGAFGPTAPDGRSAALEAIEQFAAELTDGR